MSFSEKTFFCNTLISGQFSFHLSFCRVMHAHFLLQCLHFGHTLVRSTHGSVWFSAPSFHLLVSSSVMAASSMASFEPSACVHRPLAWHLEDHNWTASWPPCLRCPLVSSCCPCPTLWLSSCRESTMEIPHLPPTSQLCLCWLLHQYLHQSITRWIFWCTASVGRNSGPHCLAYSVPHFTVWEGQISKMYLLGPSYNYKPTYKIIWTNFQIPVTISS